MANRKERSSACEAQNRRDSFESCCQRPGNLALIPDPNQIEAFAAAGVDTIRLWPRWLDDESLVLQIRQLGVRLHLNGATGKPQEVLSLLRHKPYSLLADDPATLVGTLAELKRSETSLSALGDLVELAGDTTTVPWISRPGTETFLNRDYSMLELPNELHGQPRYVFDGGSGDRVVLKFKKPGRRVCSDGVQRLRSLVFPRRPHTARLRLAIAA